MKVDFKTVDEALARKGAILPEIQRLQGWLSGVQTDATGNKVSSQSYQRERAGVISRLTQLQQESAGIREWLRKHSTGPAGAHPNQVLLGRCYRLLADRDDEPQVEQVLRDIERTVPMALLEGE